MHEGSEVREAGRAVRIEGPRMKEELGAARGRERSIVYGDQESGGTR